MADTSISAYPWLCDPLKKGYLSCDLSANNIVASSEALELDSASMEAYGLYGLKLQYYPVSKNLDRDRLFGEDQLRWILRSFYFEGYVESIPPNVRSYKIEGIWGEDMVQMFAAIKAFDYYSTYGGSDKNTPGIYEVWKPKIGDMIYMPQNGMFYDVRDVKYYDNAFGLTKHVYSLALKVYKDDKYTVSANETMPSTDPVWDVATSALTAAHPTTDILELNEALSANRNANMMDPTYKPKIPIEQQTQIDPFGGW